MSSRDIGAPCVRSGNAADLRTKPDTTCDGLPSLSANSAGGINCPPDTPPATFSGPDSIWRDPAKVEQLRALYTNPDFTCAAIGEALGVSRHAVRQKAYRLQIKRPLPEGCEPRKARFVPDYRKPDSEARPWTEEQDHILAECAETMRAQRRPQERIYARAAKLLKRTARSCQDRMIEINRAGGLKPAEKRPCLRCRTPFLKQKDIWICSNCKSSDDWRSAGWQIA